MSSVFGPSLAWGKKTFNTFFGSEEILWKVQNFVLGQYLASPWYNYAIPYEVRRKATDLWISEKT
jgi:hypothetical protein